VAAALSLAPLLPLTTGPATTAGREAQQLLAAQRVMAAAAARAAALEAQPTPAAAVDQVRRQLQVAQAEFDQRQAMRSEQAVVYWLAGHQDQEQAFLQRASGARITGLADVVQGLRALWRLGGVRDPERMTPRQIRPFAGTTPLDELVQDYRSAASSQGIDWTYLAAINYVESDFGRNDGPSGSGALGPMQFLPSTWREYGQGGDIMNPGDAIPAAARFLRDAGAPEDYDRAIYRYNHDADYVTAVNHLAAAIRADPLWLSRLYCWNTYG
jgi:membrane-bound lytic murein transglycosylase B